ncbi:MAG: MlaD family protein [Desulfuromonadales bacterium]|nr:MlaD family protein [Desulfuromonadales bacterium]
MSKGNFEMKHAEQAPQAQIQTRRSFSIIWVVPIIALLIGGWMAIKAWSEKGPEITIIFESAEGLEANKTKIKFKDVEMGTVTEIRLKQDLSGVIVTAEMTRDAEDYLTEQSQFWIVRARVAAGEVSGLETLFSGAYIGCIPSKEGQPAREFVGFEKPPIVTTGLPGRHFILAAETLGSLDVGSPVYYRGIKVGQIVGYEFDADDESVNIRVFVSAPYHEKVMQNSRFWNVSGIDFTLDTEGIKVDTQSLVSIMLGGVAFDLPEHLESSQHADQDRVFKLYANHDDTKQKTYTVKRYYLMYFDQSVRGLSPGAPVEIKGIKLGEVLDVKLVLNSDEQSFRVAIRVMIEPERIDAEIQSRVPTAATESFADERVLRDDLETLVSKGLRAQLKTGNLLTGQLYVDLDFYPAASPAEVVIANGQRIFPTIPAPLEQIAQRVDNILDEFEKVPFEKIGKELREAISALTLTLEEIKTISGSVNQETLPRINTTLEDLQGTLRGIEATIGEDSALSYNAGKLTDEFLVAIRSLRSLLDYLEREPQALIFGKEGEK